MSGRRSKSKGYNAEIEVRNLLREMLGRDTVDRVLLSGIRGEGDIQGCNARIEVKRQERMCVPTTFFRERDKVQSDLPFFLVHRRNREEWLVTVDLTTLSELVRECW